MSIKDIYETHYKEYCDFNDDPTTKYEWAAGEIFELTTYDGELDELFVKKIIEVSKAILYRHTFEYIKDEKNYIAYILVCQIFEKFNWIDWGTSIRGAWFDCSNYERRRPILDRNLDTCGVDEVAFTRDNLKALIEFIEEGSDENEKNN